MENDMQMSQQKEQQLTCIVCPQGCTIQAIFEGNELVEVKGNRCPRGKVYTEEEIFHPTRTLTTTVQLHNGVYPVVPAKSAQPIPKDKLFIAMKEVRHLVVEAPVECGSVLIADLAGTGVALVATRQIGKRVG